MSNEAGLLDLQIACGFIRSQLDIARKMVPALSDEDFAVIASAEAVALYLAAFGNDPQGNTARVLCGRIMRSAAKARGEA